MADPLSLALKNTIKEQGGAGVLLQHSDTELYQRTRKSTEKGISDNNKKKSLCIYVPLVVLEEIRQNEESGSKEYICVKINAKIDSKTDFKKQR